MCKPSYDLRVATHLNNTGVLLLQKGAYQQAAKTFREAIAVLNSNASPLQISSAALYQTCIQHAAHRLSTPKSVISHDGQQINLSVLSDMDDCPSRLLRTNNNISCVVRMESLEFEAPTENDLNMAASILFLNYGIAFKCLSFASCYESSFRESYARHAMKLFRLANAALANCQVEMKEVTQFQRILLVKLLTLQQLVEMPRQLGTEEPNNQDFANRLVSLRVKMLRMTAIKNSSTFPASAA